MHAHTTHIHIFLKPILSMYIQQNILGLIVSLNLTKYVLTL